MTPNNSNRPKIDHYVFSSIKEENIFEGHNICSYENIEGGLINYTYRIFFEDSPSVILKYYPPYIASLPEIPLSSSRCFFEKQALQRIPDIHTSPHTPKYIHGTKDINVIEDKGNLPSLQNKHSMRIVQQIAIWLGTLHECSLHMSTHEQQSWNNKTIQQSRNTNQYEYLASAISNPISQNHLRQIGHDLQKKGFCVIMGDLWPSSILIQEENFCVIDWEFSHFGRPLQDVAHICAHFVLMDQPQYCSIFLQKYLEHVSTKIQDDVLSYQATHHFCAEILMRIMGMFEIKKHQHLQNRALEILNKKESFSSLFSI